MYLDVFFSAFQKVKFAFEKVPIGTRLAPHMFNEGHCVRFMHDNPGAMIKIAQSVGDVVHVPPGWIHAVFTLQATVKLAWDYTVPESFPKYMAAWMHIGTHLKNRAQDYIGMMPSLVEHGLADQ